MKILTNSFILKRREKSAEGNNRTQNEDKEKRNKKKPPSRGFDPRTYSLLRVTVK